jgi:hypothetical protein
VGTARARPLPLVVSPGRCPPSSVLLAPWVFWQNRIFAVFSGIFPESWISAQKRDTRAILLKTTLVHVSYIQNTQIRGEIIAKVFGKVDTFWTYHWPFSWSRSFLPNSMETPGTPAGIQRCPWHTPEVIPMTLAPKTGEVSWASMGLRRVPFLAEVLFVSIKVPGSIVRSGSC